MSGCLVIGGIEGKGRDFEAELAGGKIDQSSTDSNLQISEST